jgi:hypothetical protein
VANDETTRAIDRFFDAVDGGVDKVARVLNRTQNTEEQIRDKYGKRRTIIDAETAPQKPKAKAASARAPSTTTAVAVTPRSRFYIVESVDPRSGNTIYVVTDGSSRTECSSREFAQTILRSLEKTP